MDYKKLYEDALERARDIALRGKEPKDGALSACQYIFPELRESEDEKIRKELISHINRLIECHDKPNAERDEKYESWRDWLGKQGEQKEYPQSVIDNAISFLSLRNDGMPMEEAKDIVSALLTVLKPEYWPTLRKQEFDNIDSCKPKPHKGNPDNPCDMTFENAQEYITQRGFDIPWNDCDVFVDERYITQTVANVLRWADEYPKVKDTETSETNNVELTDFEGALFTTFSDMWQDYMLGHEVNVAKAVKEHSAEFLEIANRKSLAEWSDHDEDMLNSVKLHLDNAEVDAHFYSWLDNLKDRVLTQSKQKWSDEDNKRIEQICDDLKSALKNFNENKNVKGLHFDNIIESNIEWLKSLKDKVCPQQEWSEEDIRKIDELIALCEGRKKLCSSTVPSYKRMDELKEWLKSLKDRVRPQPKQEWSDEDAKTLNRISAILVDASEIKNWWKEYQLIEREEMVRLTDFLKSLRPQSHWKPSDEQMEALYHYVETTNDGEIELLYNDLKKL